MKGRWIHTRTALGGEPQRLAAAFRNDGQRLILGAFTVGAPVHGGAVRLHTPVGVDDMARLVDVDVELGALEEVGEDLRMSVHWGPAEPDEPFSELEGELLLHSAGSPPADLTLSGQCRIANGGHDIEQATFALADRFVRAIARELDRMAGSPGGWTRTGDGRLHVRDVMTCDPIVLHEDVPVTTAVRVFLQHDIGGAPVIDSAGVLIGVLSESDLLPREAAPRLRSGPLARVETHRRRARTVGECCSRPAAFLSPDTTVREAARLLLDGDLSRLVVVDGDEIVGMLTRRNVLKALARTAGEVQASIERSLAAAGYDEVTVRVEPDGHATVRGQVPEGSDTDILRIVRAVDGVIEAEDLLAVAPA
jgi:CBS domain-containing protein